MSNPEWYEQIWANIRVNQIAGHVNAYRPDVEKEQKTIIGPDPEIEELGKQFVAYTTIHQTLMPFWRFVEIQERAKSGAWAYECNRKKSTLISL